MKFTRQPYRTMVVVAQCTGLRAEEVLALEWQDIDFENLSMKVVRAVTLGRVKDVKTEYSEDELPLDPDFASILRDWKRQSKGSALLFPSPVTGRQFHAAPSSRTISVPPDGVWWSVRSAVRLRVSGARTGARQHRTAVGSRFTRSAGRQPGSTRGGLAYLPPHLPLVAGRYRRAGGGAAEAGAARSGFDHDEYLRERFDGRQA